MNALKEIYDPEIAVSIVDLGLIYDVKVEKGIAVITMTLTSPGCPLGMMIESQIIDRVKTISEIKDVKVKIVYDPPWSPDRMSKSAKAELGMT
jgi:metal-sulfur cluster biosynthetic enzyme